MGSMSKKYKIAGLTILLLGIGLLTALYLNRYNLGILEPKGLIAAKERNLMIATVLLSTLVVIPVFVLTAVICWRYRENNRNATYTPDWDKNNKLEALWWGLPCALILILAVITWQSSHDLDPFKPLASSKKPLTVQVIALQWKWLFIYPDQRIATVNYVQFPKNTPVNFVITADAPMNSFWIPQLGGQIYAMAGMSTQSHLMASETGSFKGSSANLSGKGFASMKFTAVSSTQADFNAWVKATQKSPTSLTQESYTKLARPSENTPASNFVAYHADLYDTVIAKYMGHTTGPTHAHVHNPETAQAE
jgi:cytochrome o ubiquinol oxidase subunit 2